VVDDLCAEFASEFTRSEIEDVMDDSVDRIAETARFSDSSR
jgi:hypothetical protein